MGAPGDIRALTTGKQRLQHESGVKQTVGGLQAFLTPLSMFLHLFRVADNKIRAMPIMRWSSDVQANVVTVSSRR